MFKPFQRKDYSKANTLESLPFQDLSDLTTENYEDAVQDFCKTHAFSSKTWVYPQAVARVAKWTLSRSGDKFDGRVLLKDNIKSAWDKGFYWFLMSNKRPIVKQYMHTQYCSLTPIILSAFKTMQGIQYKDWANVEYVVNPSLLEAVSVEAPNYSMDELLQFRVTGLTTQSGKDVGMGKSTISTYGIYGVGKQLEDGRCGLGSFPQLTRIILLQTWCAHPSVRSKYSILDLNDWDNMPDPIVTEDVLATPSKSKLNLEMPW